MLSDFISLFFPRYCVGCHGALSRKEEIICIACQHEIPKTNSHIEKENFVENKFYGKVRLSTALAYYRFERKGRIQQVLHQLKYGNRPEVGQLIGQWYGLLLAEQGLDKSFDLIVPVPLHMHKLRRRGYNQSAQFGNGLSQMMNIPQDMKALHRYKRTSTQTKKSRLERWNNVSNIFKVSNLDQVRGKRVLLVDDVITTGSTLESCAHELLTSGAESVGVAAIAAAK